MAMHCNGLTELDGGDKRRGRWEVAPLTSISPRRAACNCTIVQIAHCEDIVSRVAARIALEAQFLLCN